MTVTGFSPLGNGKSYSKLGFQDVSCLEDPIIKKISQRLNVSTAQEWSLEETYNKEKLPIFSGSVKMGFGEKNQPGNQVL